MGKIRLRGIVVSLTAVITLGFHMVSPTMGNELIVESDVKGDLIKAGFASLSDYNDIVLNNNSEEILEPNSSEELLLEDNDSSSVGTIVLEQENVLENDALSEYVEESTILSSNTDTGETIDLLESNNIETGNSDDDQIELAYDSVDVYASSGNVIKMKKDEYLKRIDEFEHDDRWKGGVWWGDNKRPEVSPWDAKSCYAYCCDYSYYCLGGPQKPSEGEPFSDPSQIRTGDVVKYFTGQYYDDGSKKYHYFVVFGREEGEDVLWTAEGNYGSNQHVVRIEKGYRISGDRIQLRKNDQDVNQYYKFEEAWHLVEIDNCCEMDEGVDKVKEEEYVIVSAVSLDEDDKIKKNKPYVMGLDGKDVVVERSLSDESAVWDIEKIENKFYKIRNTEKDRVLSLDSRDKEDKTNIGIGRWYESDCESWWAFDEKWTGKYVIFNRHSGFCATRSDGDSVKQREFYGKKDDKVDNQTWLLVRPDKPTIKTSSIPNGEIGKGYSATLTGSCDEWIKIEWSLSGDSSALPKGLSLSDDGVISGTPTEAGDFTIKIDAINEFGTTTQTYSFSIGGAASIPATSVSLSKTSLEMTVGDSATLTASILPDNATDKTITWKSTNEKVATINEKGKVTAVGAGTAEIIVSTSNDKKASCKVIVSKEASGDVNIKVGSATGMAGKTVSVPVEATMTSNGRISGMALTISCDSNLVLEGIERGDLLSSGTFNPDTGKGIVQWYTAGTPVKGNGVLFTLKIRIKEGTAQGSYSVNGGLKDGLGANLTDENSNNVTAAFIGGAVVVANIVKGDVTGDGDVAMGDVVKVARAVGGTVTLTEEEKEAADVTGDKEVAMGDVVKIARFVAGTIDKL